VRSHVFMCCSVVSESDDGGRVAGVEAVGCSFVAFSEIGSAMFSTVSVILLYCIVQLKVLGEQSCDVSRYLEQCLYMQGARRPEDKAMTCGR
jgi:hypothetical protein